MKIICVEGNVASGKSTLLPKLAEAIDYTPILEPVDSDPVFYGLLEKFSNNPACVHSRNEFQIYVTNQRADLFDNLPDGNYLIERSLLSDLVFTHACMSNYENTADEAQKHMDCYKHLISRIHDYPKMDTCIYLKTSPIVAHQRMLSRGRKAEMTTPFNYLADLSRYHDAVLPQVCRKAGTKFITVNADVEIDANALVMELLAQGVKF